MRATTGPCPAPVMPWPTPTRLAANPAASSTSAPSRSRDGLPPSWMAKIASSPIRRPLHRCPKRVSNVTACKMSGVTASAMLPAMLAATPANQPSPDSNAATLAASSAARPPGGSSGAIARRNSGAPKRSAAAAKCTSRDTTISSSTALLYLGHVLVAEPVSTPDQVRGRLSPEHALRLDLEAEAAPGAMGVDRAHLPGHLVPAGRQPVRRDHQL